MFVEELKNIYSKKNIERDKCKWKESNPLFTKTVKKLQKYPHASSEEYTSTKMKKK